MADEKQETANFFRLVKVLVDLGSEALRDVMLQVLLPDTLATAVSSKMEKIDDLRKNRILFDKQYKLLTEVPPQPKKFDISLLTIILRNLCRGVPAPLSGWFEEPDQTDLSLGADIVRLRNIRNDVTAHAASTRVTDAVFENIWAKVTTVVVRISEKGSPSLHNIPERIEAVKSENLDPLHVSSQMQMMLEIFCDWQKQDDRYQSIMEELEKQGGKQDAMFELQVDSNLLLKDIHATVVRKPEASVVQPGNDQSDGTTSMGTQQDTSMPPSSVDSTLDIEDLSANFNTLDTNDDYSYLKDHFDTCIIYTEGNGDKAEQVRSFIAGLDGDFKVVVSDDEKYFGFFTPENLPAVFSKHCVVFMIIIADNLQEDKLAKYLRSTVSMDKANTAQVRPLLFSKSDEKLIPKSLSNTKPIRWYDEYYLRSELPKLLNQCKDRRMIREEKQIKTPKDIQLDD